MAATLFASIATPFKANEYSVVTHKGNSSRRAKKPSWQIWAYSKKNKEILSQVQVFQSALLYKWFAHHHICETYTMGERRLDHLADLYTRPRNANTAIRSRSRVCCTVSTQLGEDTECCG